MSLRLTCPTPSPDLINLAAEADHRIANHLTVIKGIVWTQANALRWRREPLSGAEAGAILDGLGAKVEAISLLHRHLAHAEIGGKRSLGDYLRELLDGIGDALADGDVVEFEFAGDSDCALDPRKTATIGLIVCELVTNAMKHAHPSGVGGQVRVRCRAEASLATEVEDDGVGLPEAFDAEAARGLGFRTMHAMAAQIGATLEFHSGGLGLTAVLRVPLAAQA